LKILTHSRQKNPLTQRRKENRETQRKSEPLNNPFFFRFSLRLSFSFAPLRLCVNANPLKPLEIVYYPPYPASHHSRIEVEQQPKMFVCETQVRQQLDFVNRRYLFDGFYFYYNQVIDQQIDSIRLR